ncbi:MAG: amidohydrolase family protein [Planctomycetota bacterium]
MHITRRQAIKAGAVALGAGLVTGCQTIGGGASGVKAGYVDAHAHVWSDDLAKYPLGPWATKASMKPATFTDDELLAVVKPHGVSRVVLIQHAPLHGYDNLYILDCAKKRPGTFSVVAMINERTPDLKDRLRDLRDQGARGIRIGPTKHADRTLNVDPPNWLKAPGQQLLWQHAAELGVAVCPLLGPDFLPTVDPMCERFPDTTVVIDHFAHIDMAKPETVNALTKLARHQNVYVKVSAFYKFGDKKAPYEDIERMVIKMVEAFGPDRLMWASDLPYQLNNGNNYEDAIGLMTTGLASLSDSERRMILQGTASKVFF